MAKNPKKTKKQKRSYSQNYYSKKNYTEDEKKKFYIATEGRVTEIQYFEYLNRIDELSEKASFKIECVKKYNDKSAPIHVKNKMEDFLSGKTNNKPIELGENDRAWIVIDKDKWTNEQIMIAYNWTKLDEKYKFALSNTKFEFWLLIHFETGDGVDLNNCDKRLEKYIGEYDKNLDMTMFNFQNITHAIKVAEKKDNPKCKCWPKETGTTVYKIFKELFDEDN